MDKYCVTGMSCAACSSRVESAVRKLNNVNEVSVNLLTNSMTVIGTAKPEEVIRAVENAGYGDGCFFPQQKEGRLYSRPPFRSYGVAS